MKKIMSEVTDEVHLRFKRACLERNETMKDVISNFMLQYAEDYETKKKKGGEAKKK